MEMELGLGHRLDQAARAARRPAERRSGVVPCRRCYDSAATDRSAAMSTILVTGASGFVGSHTVPALLAAGHRVVALVRTPTAGRGRPRPSAGRADAARSRSGSAT